MFGTAEFEILEKSFLNNNNKKSQWIISTIYKLIHNYKSIELSVEKNRTVENGCFLEAGLGRYIRRLSCFHFKPNF